LDPEDRDRLERTRGQGTAGTGEDLLPGEAGGPPVRLEVTSLAFEDGEALPGRCAHDDENVSPPLEWSAAPDGTVELAVVCEDLDAPTGRFTHWVLSGIEPSATGVEEGEVPTGAVMGPTASGRSAGEGRNRPPVTAPIAISSRSSRRRHLSSSRPAPGPTTCATRSTTTSWPEAS
jgi:hypothetical protein